MWGADGSDGGGGDRVVALIARRIFVGLGELGHTFSVTELHDRNDLLMQSMSQMVVLMVNRGLVPPLTEDCLNPA